MAEAGTKPTVFIVDDADDVRFLLRVVLEKAGYEVVGEAVTGEEALASAPGLTPAVVLVDMVLPDLSGIEVVRGLRGALPDSRILVCSGGRADEGTVAARAAGADGWVDKAAVPNLVTALEQALAAPGWGAD